MDIILIIAIIIAVIAWLAYSSGFWEKVKQYQTKSTAKNIGGKLKALDQTIGETGAVCPTCGTELTTLPEESSPKMECPHCGSEIHRRKRPYDNENILANEQQLEQVQEQWAIVTDEHERYLKEQKRRKKITDHLKQQSGTEPDREEVDLQALEEQAIELEHQSDWGLARNKRKERADRLRKYEKREQALQAYLEVCYLDANGPRNVGNAPADAQNLAPFSEDVALVAPGVLKKVAQLIKTFDLSLDKVKKIYLDTAQETHQRIEAELPKNPTEAWAEFRDIVT